MIRLPPFSMRPCWVDSSILMGYALPFTHTKYVHALICRTKSTHRDPPLVCIHMYIVSGWVFCIFPRANIYNDLKAHGKSRSPNHVRKPDSSFLTLRKGKNTTHNNILTWTWAALEMAYIYGFHSESNGMTVIAASECCFILWQENGRVMTIYKLDVMAWIVMVLLLPQLNQMIPPPCPPWRVTQTQVHLKSTQEIWTTFRSFQQATNSKNICQVHRLVVTAAFASAQPSAPSSTASSHPHSLPPPSRQST